MSPPLSSAVCLCPTLLPNHVRSNPAHLRCPHSPTNYSNPENGCNMFVRNIGIPVLQYAHITAHQPCELKRIVEKTSCSLKPSTPSVGHRRWVGTGGLSPALTGRDVKLTTHLHLAFRFRMNGVDMNNSVCVCLCVCVCVCVYKLASQIVWSVPEAATTVFYVLLMMGAMDARIM